MTTFRTRNGAALAGLLSLALAATACTSPRARRTAIADISAEWAFQLEAGTQAESIEPVRKLGNQDPEDPSSMVSVLALARQARPQGNPSALVRAECLLSAWKLGADLPREELRVDELDAQAFSERTRRFELLAADPGLSEGAELLELASFLGNYRFPPGDEDLALDLAELVVSRALWTEPSPVSGSFAATAPASVRHALVLVTLRLADDPNSTVREEALRATRHMVPGPGLDLIAGALSIEIDSEVLLAALDSLELLADELSAEQRARILSLLPPGVNLTVRRRADQIRRAQAGSQLP